MAKNVEDDAGQDDGTNTIDPARLAKELRRIEDAIEAKESYRMRYVEGCKPYNEKISNAYQIASKACNDLPIKLLKAKVRERDLLRKAEGIREDFEDDDRDLFDQVTQALGGYADTPLGKAALDAAASTAAKPKGGRKASSAVNEPAKNSKASAEAGEDSEAYKQGRLARDKSDGCAIPNELQGVDRDRWHNGWLSRDAELNEERASAENAEKLNAGIRPLH